MEDLRTTKRLFGGGTVEIILALSLFMMYGAFIIGALAYSVSTTKIPNTQKSAIQYASEGMEAIRYMRKTSLTNLTNGTYGLNNSGTEWTLVGSPDVINTNYTRTITISAPTASEKLVTSSVAWTNAGRTGSESVVALFSDWQEIIIPPSTAWQVPTFNKFHQIAATIYDVVFLQFLNGTLYTTLTNGITSSWFSSFNISAFPTITQGTSVNLGVVATDTTVRYSVGDGLARTYYTSAANAQEVSGINMLTRTSFGNYNMGGNNDTSGIAAVGSLLYVTRLRQSANPTFIIIQNTGTATYTELGNYTFANPTSMYDVVVNGNYAYVTGGDPANDLLVVNITNSAAPALAVAINTPSATGTSQVIIGGNDLFVLTDDTGVHMYDITNPAAPTFVSTFATSGAINAADVDTTRKLLFLATANATAEFQVMRFTTPATPTLHGSYNSTIPFLSIAWDSVNDRMYLGSSDNTNEITVLNAQ